MGCWSSKQDLSEPSMVLAPSSAFFERYALGCQLGQGSFAHVLEAHPSPGTSHLTGRFSVCAVKVTNLSGSSGSSQFRSEGHRRQQQVLNEVRIWESLGMHRNCAALFEAFCDRHCAYLVMEKCLGSLHMVLRKSPLDNERSAFCICRDMLAGVAHLHAADVVHCDVKPSNFLVSADGRTVKLCDFGLSRRLPKAHGVIGGYKKLQGATGTVPYMSPEMLSVQGYDTRTDIWSTGSTLYTLLFGKWPYGVDADSTEVVKAAIRNGLPAPSYMKVSACPTASFDPSQRLVSFVRSLLDRDPCRRPSAELALRSWTCEHRSCQVTAAKGLPGQTATPLIPVHDDVKLREGTLARREKRLPSPPISEVTTHDGSSSWDGLSAGGSRAVWRHEFTSYLHRDVHPEFVAMGYHDRQHAYPAAGYRATT